MVNAPVINKKAATAPLHVRLPDGASIKYSHTCDLDLTQLPDAARKVHVISGLTTISLLSVRKLVDSNCSIIFDKALPGTRAVAHVKQKNVDLGPHVVWMHDTLVQQWTTISATGSTSPSPTQQVLRKR
jgi:hypothetical protein